MKKNFVIALLLLGLFSPAAPAITFDQLYHTFKKERNVCDKIALGSVPLFFMSAFVGKDPDTKLKKLRSISLEDATPAQLAMAKECFDSAESLGYAPLITVNEDGEEVRLLVKGGDECFDEVVMLLWEDDEINFVQLWGKITPNDITIIDED